MVFNTSSPQSDSSKTSLAAGDGKVSGSTDKSKAKRSDRFPKVEGILQDIEAKLSRLQMAA